MKNKRLFLLIPLLFMTIGYAALNTTMNIDASALVGMNSDFLVKFTSVKINNVVKTISDAKDSFIFELSEIKSPSSIVDYEIANESSQYDAKVSISCTNGSNLSYEGIDEEFMVDAKKSVGGQFSVIPKSREKLYNHIKNSSIGLDTASLNYDQISSSTNGEGIYETKNTDTGDSVYFYRGNIANNNVIFAGFCWQILRTTETGGVKLFFNGSPSNGTCASPSGYGIGTFPYNSANNDNAYAGYMYGTAKSSTYAATHENKNDSVLKTEIDKWYEANLLGTEYEKYLEDTVWCNDRSIPTDKSNWTNNPSTYTQTGIGTGLTLYGFAVRGGSYANITTPTLKCANANDAFTVSSENGNGNLKYKIGTITADEMIYAGATGGKYGTVSADTSPVNPNYFLANPSANIWTMTPTMYGSPIGSGYQMKGSVLYQNGALSTMWTNVARNIGDIGIRPAISVQNDTYISSGDGSFSNPYTLEKFDDSEETSYTCRLNIKAIERDTTAEAENKSIFDVVKEKSLGTDADNNIDYNQISSSTNGEGVYETNATQNGSTTYFYRGNVTDNNVIFAGHCWKMVRTTENNGVKLIYNGAVDSAGSCTNTGVNTAIGTSNWSDNISDNAYVGYMYGTTGSTSYNETHKNTNDSKIKKIVDTWYENNILGTDYEGSIEDTVYCNDRSMTTDVSNIAYNDWVNHSSLTLNGYGNSNTFYKGTTRVGTAVGVTKPTLLCENVNDRLTSSSSNGTGSLKYPIGLLTADEAVYAGSTGGVLGKTASNTNYYLHNGEKHFWTMTPHRYYNNNLVVLVVADEGNISNEVAKTEAIIRPVIAIKGDTKVIQGNGTSVSPYVLTNNSSSPSPPTSKIPADWQDNGIFSDYYDQAYDKLQTMTLEEKIGQLFIVRYNNKTVSDAIPNYHVGGTTFYATDFNNKTEAQVKTMTNNVQTASKIPMITAVDEEGGKVVRVSSNSNLASEPFKASKELYDTGGLALITKDTVNKSALLLNLGLNMNFAPVVDIADPTSYIYARTVGYGADITAEYAKTVVEASKNTGVSYSLKHFPGYGNNSDTHSSGSTDETSLEELWNKHLVPFKAAVEDGAEAVMISHNTVAALDKESPSSLSKPVHDLLLDDLKFTGVVLTDDLDMSAVTGISDRYLKALQAGNNLILLSDYASAQSQILTGILNGTITEDYINKKVFKVLAWKYYKGLL